jgi:hypothetical protein
MVPINRNKSGIERIDDNADVPKMLMEKYHIADWESGN